MRKIEIDLSEEQFQAILSEMKRGTEINLQEETFSGFSFELSVVEGSIAWLEFKMLKNLDLGEVNWQIK